MQAEPPASRGQPRRLTLAVVLPVTFAMIQGIDFLVLAALAAVVGLSAANRAAADHKPTAASLSLAFAVVGALLFAVPALLAFVFAWWLHRRKGWAFWSMAALEGLWLLLAALWLLRGWEVATLLQIVLAGATLLALLLARFAARAAQAVSRA